MATTVAIGLMTILFEHVRTCEFKSTSTGMNTKQYTKFQNKYLVVPLALHYTLNSSSIATTTKG